MTTPTLDGIFHKSLSLLWEGSLLIMAGFIITVIAEMGVRFMEPYFSPLRHIPGSRTRGSLLLGHVEEMVNGDGYKLLKDMYKTYGHVMTFRAFFGSYRCALVDNKAVAHVFQNHMIYYKPDEARNTLTALIGNGLVSSEGFEHRHQRRIMMPAFSAGHLRDILPIFLAKSAELRDVLNEMILATGTPSTERPSLKVDMVHWLSRATLDIIGLAGFNYDFNTLRRGEEGNELASAFHDMMASPWLLFLKGLIVSLRVITFDSQSRLIKQAHRVMRRVGLQLIGDKMRDITEEKASAGGTVIEQKGHDKDLLSLMIKSNMSTTTPPEQRLSVDQILHQIPTFLGAGHETTSTSTAWCLLALSQNFEVQSRLRAELLQAFPLQSVKSELGDFVELASEIDGQAMPSVEDLNSLTYLDAVVRETLRFHPPVENTFRVAIKDDVIPLDKPFTRLDGQVRDYIDVKKGDHFMVPIKLMNRLEEVWGDDAETFNPERWLHDLPQNVSKVPGLWANLLTFLNGQRSCIGFKFAILEMKALLFHLVRSFEFELAVPIEDVGRYDLIVSRPMLLSQKEKGAQLPMIIRPVKPSSI